MEEREKSIYERREEKIRQLREKLDYEELEENLSQLIQDKDQININDLEEIYRCKGGVTDSDFGNILGEKLEERRANREYRERVDQLKEMEKARKKAKEEAWKEAYGRGETWLGFLVFRHKKDVASRVEIEEEINYLYDINNYIEIWKQAIKNEDTKDLVVLYDIFWAVEYWKKKGRKLKQLEGSQLNIVDVKKNLKDDELSKIRDDVNNTRKKYRTLLEVIGLDPEELKMSDSGGPKYFTPRGTETLIFSILLNTTPDSLKKLLELKTLTKNKLKENVEVITDIIDTMDKVGVAEEKGINYQDIIKAELNYRTCMYIKENHNNFIEKIEAIIKNIISLRAGKNIDLIGPRVMEFYYEYLIGETKNYVDVLKNIEPEIRGVIKPVEKDVISRIDRDQVEEIKENEYLDLIEAIMRDRYPKEIKAEGRLENKLYEYVKNGRF